MKFGICGLSLIPVRSEPSERSEMVTQILFGEHFEIIEYLPGWCHVVLAFDGYRGWIDQKMMTPISERQCEKIEKSLFAITTDIFTPVEISKDQSMLLVAGSTLPLWRPYLKEFAIDGVSLSIQGNVSLGNVKEPRELIIEQALKYFNAPYLWGGRSPMGIDCSGLTQVIYKMAGVVLPRDASQQVLQGICPQFCGRNTARRPCIF
jgi:gamma-D-glutamyl-L-lysine dipeptidyl-peptidase